MTLDGVIHDLTIDTQLKMEGVGHDLPGVWGLRDGAEALEVQGKQCFLFLFLRRGLYLSWSQGTSRSLKTHQQGGRVKPFCFPKIVTHQHSDIAPIFEKIKYKI